jgi:hypothetical protein
LNKCSIEGGIFNADQFQKNLLNKQIGYDELDGRELYMDAGVNDGTSLNFLFGTERDEVFNTNKEENKHYGREKLIVGVKYVRNRFDLIYDTPEMTKLSLLWLNRFVDFMKENSTKLFNYIDIAYSTSHHLEKEIEYYSRIDAKYFMISISFLIVFFFGYIWFDFQTNRKYFLKCFNTEKTFKKNVANETNVRQEQEQEEVNSRKNESTNKRKISRFDFYLPFLCLIQIIFTITSTISLLNLLNVVLTPILMTNILILLIINFNQTLNLFKAISTIKRSKISDSCYKINVLKRLTFTFQNLLIPQMYASITIMCTYLTVACMTQFEAIRLYCICTSI